MIAAATALWLLEAPATQASRQPDQSGARLVALTPSPTVHPPVPATLSDMWLAPAEQDPRAKTMYAGFLRGVQLLEESGDAAAAYPLVSASALASTPVAAYARHYTGLALLQLGRLEGAEATFAALAARDSEGFLREESALRLGEVRETRGDRGGALEAYETLLKRSRPSSPATVLLRIATLAEGADRASRAVEAYQQIYREYPLTPESSQAEIALTRLRGWDIDAPERQAQELARADTLFRARRWASARAAFERLRDVGSKDDRELVDIRLAAIEVLSAEPNRSTRDVLRRYSTADEPRAEEARFYLLAATRQAGDAALFEQLTRQYVQTYPRSLFAEDALNNLATHYIVTDRERDAERVFLDIIERYPTGRHTERAAWRAGWWAYRADDFRRAIDIFGRASAAFPRSDYRPAWLYWSARGYEEAGMLAEAVDRHRLAVSDYANTYYGRLSSRRLEAHDESAPPRNVKRVSAPPDSKSLPANSDNIVLLLSLGLWREAIQELQYAQRMWGDSPRLQASLALVHNRLGNLRLGINTMKRAYPQYMAAGGEDLPTAILKVLFPVDYWSLLKRSAAAHGLDPYLVAALVAQESTFDPVVRSSANAIGLMQVLPSTGAQFARKLGIRPFSAARLTEPEVNVRIGTDFLAGLITQFGAAHFALASYNAGEGRVRKWKAERPGMSQDEFIDDIPFPETQNYVKRILGTAEDYRRLYGGSGADTTSSSAEGALAPPPRKVAPAKKPSTKKPPSRRAPAKKTPRKPPAKGA